MRINSLSPSLMPPLAAVVGAYGSAYIFHKILHILEYTLIKQFGDYQNARVTRNEEIIVTTSLNTSIIKDAIPLLLTHTIFYSLAKALTSYNYSPTITNAFFIGSRCGNIISFLAQVFYRMNEGLSDQKWLKINHDSEKGEIHQLPSIIKLIPYSVLIYDSFGQPPKLSK